MFDGYSIEEMTLSAIDHYTRCAYETDELPNIETIVMFKDGQEEKMSKLAAYALNLHIQQAVEASNKNDAYEASEKSHILSFPGRV